MSTTIPDKYINPLINFDFKKLFEAAETGKFTPKEQEAYQSNLKYYRDIKNVIDTSFKEGEEQGFKQGLKQVAKSMKLQNIPFTTITQLTGLSEQEIEEL